MYYIEYFVFNNPQKEEFMKKSYIIPTVNVVYISKHCMLTQSVAIGADGSANSAEGRRGSAWDDED